MESNHPLLHPTPPNASRPLPIEPPPFPFHNSQNIGQIWTELASITVSAFTPQLISRLRTFISHTPCFELDNHLQMLGAIVVRHVTLCLSDPDRHTAPLARNQSQPPLSRPHTRAKRRSYRDLAYHAVRINRIVPQSQPLQMEPTSSSSSSSASPSPPSTSSTTTKMPRRLSIQKATSLIHVAQTRPSTTIRGGAHTSNAATKENDNVTLNRPSAVSVRSNQSVALREETLSSRSPNRAQVFPRANATTLIESASMRNIHSPTSRQRVLAKPQNRSEYASRFKNDSSSAAPMSPLLQQRKQRAANKTGKKRPTQK